MADEQPAAEPGSRLDRKDAETLVRGWNLLFNRCFSYSVQHPLVQSTIPKVWEHFQSAMLQCGGGLNILLQETAFFVDGIDIRYQPNNQRVAEHLKRFRIESLSFQQGFSEADFSVFVDACSLTHPDPQAFLRYVQQKGGSNLDVNKVALRAIREGEVVGGASNFGQGAAAAATGGPSSAGGSEAGSFEDIVMRAMVGRLTASEMEGNVALVQLLADPQAMGKAAIEGTAGMAPEARASGMGQMVLNVLSHFATQKARSGFSIEELLAGIYSMRSEMLSMVKSQRNLDQGLAEDEVEAAADAAFDQTVSRIIVDEWQTSKANLKRVAHVLGRVVPGKKELRRVLPRLKQALLDSGCTLQDWYALVAELANVLHGDKALEQLAEAAVEFGVGPDEVIQELRRDPKGAARLLLVASEIRKSGGDNASEQAIQAMLDTLENTGDALAEEAGKTPGRAVEIVGMMQNLHGQMKQELTQREMEPAYRGNIERKLDLRMARALSDLKARVFASSLLDNAKPEDEKVATMMELVRDEGEVDGLLQLALSMTGTDETVQAIGRQIAEKVALRLRDERERAVSKELPQGVYPKAVAEFFLRYETRRCARYGVPFSVILLSIHGLPEDKESLERSGAALRGLYHVLSGDLRRQLRDVDFVGSLGYNRLLVVLPMAVAEGLDLVVGKIRQSLRREVVLPDGSRSWVRARAGAASFDRPDNAGIREVMAAVSQAWQEDL